MADNVNETSNIERVDNRDPFENANNASEAQKPYFRQDAKLYTGQYADDDDRKWTDTDSWIDNPDFIDNQDKFIEQYNAGTIDTNKRSTKESSNKNNNKKSKKQNKAGPNLKVKSNKKAYGPSMGVVAGSDVDWLHFYPTVQGRHNALHDLNSYNYIITLVSVSNDQINDPETYKGKIINANGVENKDFYIIAKSGGYQREIGPTYAAADYKRDLLRRDQRDKDLFIENLDFELDLASMTWVIVT